MPPSYRKTKPGSQTSFLYAFPRPSVKPEMLLLWLPLKNLLQSSNISLSDPRFPVEHGQPATGRQSSRTGEDEAQAAPPVQSASAERRLHTDGLCGCRVADCVR